ncbi:hypothetical protein OF829_10280 [Sphingomonas sp. LB-2]|uniref:hypothetical protein n=1 Tax=Sphingomonas caeni TaxID=2984949 RepID=UPI00222EC027|nr:hypothetical protein [Sphingomonas caeni]MCW3847630.1 hypothetical protein [Sphingomonas caeni]
MATAAENTTGDNGEIGSAAFIDRWIYVFMAGLFIVTVLAGFIPHSMGMLGDVAAGRRPPLPPILHIHAVLMGSWLTLLFVQAVLMATGRRGFHMQLGLLGMVLAPAMVIAGFILIPTMDGQIVEGIRHGPPEVATQLRAILPLVMNIMLIQIRAGFVFAVLVAIALTLRKSDSEVHKRLLFLATAAPLPAATDRMTWLPSSLPGTAWSVEFWPLVVLSPLILWDLYRQRGIHRAYWIWLGVAIVPATLMHALWGSDWWFKTALGLLGASDLAQ